MDEKSRAFIFGERLKDAPDIPQMTREQMEECINETEEYIPKTVKGKDWAGKETEAISIKPW